MSIRIALAGNPNSGKTTLFNALTGSNQFVGNWPGVTVEKKEGRLKSDQEVLIVDLPGIYSLSPYTLEEVVARNYLINERPDAIINIVDGTNIERNLYLSTQLMELGIPVVLAVNMMDVLERSGSTIDVQKLSGEMGCAAIAISALRGSNILEAAEQAAALARAGGTQKSVHRFDERLEQAIGAVERKLSGIPEVQKRFFAIKLLERDGRISDMIPSTPEVEDVIRALEQDFDDDAESVITNERYVYVTSVIRQCCTGANTGQDSLSDRIDKIVTNRILALPIFAAVMLLV